MQRSRDGAMNRRYAIGALAAGAAGLVIPGQVQIRAITQRGMVGGGLARFDSSEAEFSIFASRFTLPDVAQDIVVGHVLWHDAKAEITFASTDVSGYDLIETAAGEGETRRIIGTMRVNEGEQYPFVLNVTDAGRPGEGLDSVALIVGAGVENAASPAAGDTFSYAAAGPIVIGDVQDVELEIGGAATESASTPAN